MAWSTSRRRERLPGDWKSRRKKVLLRDASACRWVYPNGGTCGKPATDVDHIDRRGGDGLENLRALCREHHAWKSAREGAEARMEKKKRIENLIAHDVEQPHLLAVPRPPSRRRGF